MKSLQEYLITEANRHLKDLRAADKAFGKTHEDLRKQLEAAWYEKNKFESNAVNEFLPALEKETDAKIKEKCPRIYRGEFDIFSREKDEELEKEREEYKKIHKEYLDTYCDKRKKILDSDEYKALDKRVDDISAAIGLNKENAIDWLHHDILDLKKKMEETYANGWHGRRNTRSCIAEYFLSFSVRVEEDIKEIQKLVGKDLTDEVNDCCAKLKLSFLTFKDGKVQPIDIKNKDFANMWKAVKAKEKK